MLSMLMMMIKVGAGGEEDGVVDEKGLDGTAAEIGSPPSGGAGPAARNHEEVDEEKDEIGANEGKEDIEL